ncbi:MAG: hypothetical protein IPO81_06075 [Kouleothrix sp.]|nr:hypothetical protein [Kouleothrix sp.]
MRWLHWLRARLLPVTSAEAQRRVNTIDGELARRRAEVAALPAEERAAHTREIQALIAEQAHARNMLSDALDDRAER